MSDAPEDQPSDQPTELPPASKRRRVTLNRSDIEARAHGFEEEFKAQFASTRAQIDARNVKIVERTGRNLPAAIAIGLGLGLALLASLIFVKAFFMIFAGALIGFTAFELATALRFSGRDVPRWPTVIAGLATVPAAFFLGTQGHWIATIAGVCFVTIWRLVEVAIAHEPRSTSALLGDVGAGVLVQVYVSFLGGFAVVLDAQEGGQWWTLGFLILVVSVDVGAYATGLNFGKHKMAPRISPKKTWEGFAGSVLFALVAGVLIALFMIHEPWWFGLIFGAAMVFTATIGDLLESLIKRDLGIKDISSFLPGHGGLLDRLDSTLPSAVVAYGLYLVVTGGP